MVQRGAVLLRPRLTLADRLDRCEAKLRRVLEKVGVPQPWLHEFCAYRDAPRMTIEEFWVRYTLIRMAAEPRFAAVETEADARDFYENSDYMMWRNLVHRRHTSWRRVLATMGDRGNFLEFGCGIAPISTYVAQRRPRWHYSLIDLPSAHRTYAEWRLIRHALSVRAYDELPITFVKRFHVITAVDVLEHLADPYKIACRLVHRLEPGGYLHWNFVGNERHNDLDLATDEQRLETVKFLETHLTLVWERDGYRVSRLG